MFSDHKKEIKKKKHIINKKTRKIIEIVYIIYFCTVRPKYDKRSIE